VRLSSRAIIAGALIVGAALLSVALQASGGPKAKPKPFKHTDGTTALITPPCQDWRECHAIANECPRGYETLSWRELRAPVEDSDTRARDNLSKSGEEAGGPTYDLVFRCLPPVTVTPVELVRGPGWKVAPCTSEDECKVHSAARCPHGYLVRNQDRVGRKFPGQPIDLTAVESETWKIQCRPAPADVAESEGAGTTKF
jgi:hypothetical protein